LSLAESDGDKMNNNQLRLRGWLRVYNYEVRDLEHAPAAKLRRECSLSERSCEFKSVFHWQFHCSHDKLWCAQCAQCERIGISRRERAERWNKISHRVQRAH